jgi:hypothetical protein
MKKRERGTAHTHTLVSIRLHNCARERERGWRWRWQTLSGQKNKTKKSLFPPSISQWGRAPALKWTPRLPVAPVWVEDIWSTREKISEEEAKQKKERRRRRSTYKKNCATGRIREKERKREN